VEPTVVGTVEPTVEPAVQPTAEPTVAPTLGSGEPGTSGGPTTDTSGQAATGTTGTTAGQPTGTTASQPTGTTTATATTVAATEDVFLTKDVQTVSGCKLKPFKAYVRRKNVRKVTFKVDGRRVAVDRKPNRKGQYIARIKPGKLKAGAHVLTATVTYKAKTKKAKTLTLRFRKCDQCQSRRSFVVHPRGLHKGEHALSVKVYVNGRLYKSAKGGSTRLVLKGMSRGIQQVKIVARTDQGRRVVDHRKFRTCMKKAATKKKARRR
jgi:hypothetical protein